MKRALITGITGQDGHYLTQLLQQKGYEVHGYLRRTEEALASVGVKVHVGDLLDPAALRQALVESWPQEVYNLGAQSHVGASFLDPRYSMCVTYEPLLTILEQLKQTNKSCRVYQASSSEMFGSTPPPQNEQTPFKPRSPYAVAKVAAHNLVKLYRDAYDMFVVGGILFNHEGPRRGPAFVTRKITLGVARIVDGSASELVLGNLDAKRDWSFAGDMVKGMHLMLQQDAPKDYVLASGEAHSVREFVEAAFAAAAGITGKQELLAWERYVKVDDRYKRPAEVPALCGDASRAREELGWVPEVGFEQLVRMMVEADLGPT